MIRLHCSSLSETIRAFLADRYELATIYSYESSVSIGELPWMQPADRRPSKDIASFSCRLLRGQRIGSGRHGRSAWLEGRERVAQAMTKQNEQEG